MAEGYLSLVLHAHLPYVRHPEHEHFLEEQWLFEAIVETYIPLLKMLEKLEDDSVDYSLLVSLSPTLVTMFEDSLLQERFSLHIRKLIRLAEKEVSRTAGDGVFSTLAAFYLENFRDVLYWYETRYQKRLAHAFQRIASFGHLELMTCAATHGFLPLLKVNPGSVRAQIHTAVEYHQSVFGVHPRGMWLPECAYYSGVEEILHEAGISYVFVDSHGIENATEKPKFGVYAPVYTPNGVAFFGRDKETSYQVWAAEVGYPGHADYREFYRDIGYDLPAEDVEEFLIDGEIRANTGMKYFRITHQGEHKEVYAPAAAKERAAEHAGNFIFNRQKQIEHLSRGMDRPPLIVAPYDAELFGHWWFEGPQFLDFVFRKLCFDQEAVETITPSSYLRELPENQVTTPAGSSWGGDGTYEYWLNQSNQDILRGLHQAADTMSESARGKTPDDRQYRVLQQMSRELMLAQASDWPFVMRTGTSPEYARQRVETHLSRFWALTEMLTADRVDETQLSMLEFVDNIFPGIKPEWYG